MRCLVLSSVQIGCIGGESTHGTQRILSGCCDKILLSKCAPYHRSVDSCLNPVAPMASVNAVPSAGCAGQDDVWGVRVSGEAPGTGSGRVVTHSDSSVCVGSGAALLTGASVRGCCPRKLGPVRGSLLERRPDGLSPLLLCLLLPPPPPLPRCPNAAPGLEGTALLPLPLPPLPPLPVVVAALRAPDGLWSSLSSAMRDARVGRLPSCMVSARVMMGVATQERGKPLSPLRH